MFFFWLKEKQQTSRSVNAERTCNATDSTACWQLLSIIGLSQLILANSKFNSKLHNVTALWACITQNGTAVIFSLNSNLKYLGIHIVCSRGFKCSLTAAKRSVYRTANSVSGKIGGQSSEDVILQLMRGKCMPALLYILCVCQIITL